MYNAIRKSLGRRRLPRVPEWTFLPTLAIFILATIYTSMYAPGWLTPLIVVPIWAIIAPLYFAAHSRSKRRRR